MYLREGEGKRAEGERERDSRENFCWWDTREEETERERARRKFENSRKHCSGKPTRGNVHTRARARASIHACTHILEESIQNAARLPAARVGSCARPVRAAVRD